MKRKNAAIALAFLTRAFLTSAMIATLTLVASAVRAQGIATGSLSGHVEAEGQALPGVSVEATSPQLQGKRTAVSNGNGDFIIAGLPPGQYTVAFSLDGFQPQSQAVKVSGAQDSRLALVLGTQAITETIGVTALADTISTNSEASATLTAKLIEQLPVTRDVRGTVLLNAGVNASGPNNAITIAGAQSYENLFLVNGVVINENLRGTPNNLFIEDAIQETTTQISGVSAEYGRFAGGVVNTITKSGGNTFSGSLRDSLTNDKWVAPTPKTVDRNDKVEPTFEATLGGRILRDRLWFFAAGRSFDTNSKGQTVATDIPFDAPDRERRGEGKLTWALNDAHRVIGSYIKIDRDLKNDSFAGADIADRASLIDRSLPQHLLALNYNGVLASNLVVEGQYSERKFEFLGEGSKTTDRLGGTWIESNDLALRFNSPTFCAVCGAAESRSNRSASAKASWLATGAGTHDLAFGVESFDDIRKADNFQSGSGFSVFSTSAIVRGQEIFPVFDANDTQIVYWPIAATSRGTHFRTNSAYVNDLWRLGERWSASLGLRYDKNDGKDSAGKTVTKDSRLSPRLGLTYDVGGDGAWLLHASYGHYVTAIANTQGDSSSPNGVPSIFAWFYDGPDVNTGSPATPVGSAEALRRLFSWFDSVGGVNNQDLLFFVNIPGGTRVIGDGLASPYAREIHVGTSRQLGGRGSLRVDYVRRDYRDFYADFIDTSTGKAETSLGLQDVGVLRNSNDGLSRTYDGLLTQLQYRFDRINVGATWTLSKTRGNVSGETAGSGPVSSSVHEYPEYKQSRWNSPTGYLGTDQRHRVRIWGVFDAFRTDHNHLSVGVMQRLESGTPYGALGSVDPRRYVTNPGYATLSNKQSYYFTGRDKFRTENVLATDLTLNYSFTSKLFGSEVELFVEPEILNVLNAHAIVDSRFIDTSVKDATNDPTHYQRFNPFTDTPVEGVNWAKGAKFGQALSPDAYQTPRTFRVSLGIRF